MATLLDLTELLTRGVVTVVAAPSGLDVTLRRVVIYDPLRATEFEGGDLVLGVGFPPDSRGLLRLGGTSPAAIVVSASEPIGEVLIEDAIASGVALLLIPPSIPWSTLTDLALSLVTEVESLSLGRSTSASEVVEDLFALANVVADWVRSPVTIEDTQSRLLAYSASHEGADAARSATILGHRVPDSYRKEVRRLGIAKRLLTETDVIFIPSISDEIVSRSVIALRSRGEVLGSMWAMTDEPFDDERREAFCRAASIVSIRLVHHRLTSDMRIQHERATLELILRGGVAGTQAAQRLGLAADGYRVVAIGMRSFDPDEQAAVLDLTSHRLALQLFSPTGLVPVARLGHTVYALLSCDKGEPEGLERCRAVIHALTQSLDQANRDQLLFAIGGQASSIMEVSRSREEADQVLGLLRDDSRGRRTAHIDELGMELTLHRLAQLQTTGRAGQHGVLDVIVAYDQRHGTHYLPTLRLYLSTFGDANAAAAALDIHTNTLRYRLRRLRELFDVDLDDEDVRLALMLHFRLDRSLGR